MSVGNVNMSIGHIRHVRLERNAAKYIVPASGGKGPHPLTLRVGTDPNPLNTKTTG